jgi:uncharacterized membrane protein
MVPPIRSFTTVLVLALVVFATTVSLSIAQSAKPGRVTTAEGLAAWNQVYSVLISTATQLRTIHNKATIGTGISPMSYAGQKATACRH